MFKSIRAASAAGYRAGRVEPRVLIVGGTHGIKRIVEPTNPFNDVFNPHKRNWFLAMVWEQSRLTGMAERLYGIHVHG